MSPSRGRKGAGKGGKTVRVPTPVLFLALAVVALLLGSLAYGVGQHFWGTPTAPPVVDEGGGSAATAPAERVRVEVLNASGRPGLARQATDVLRDRGFDVVHFGNAPGGYAPDSSLVLDRVGKMEAARRVADAAGIHRVQARPDANLYLDVTVVLGRDWRAPGSDAP